MKQIAIGTRDSKLALWQAQWVKDFLTSYYSDVDFILIPMKTKGDKILDIPLPKIGDKGLFTMELEQGLLSGEVDMAVHSLKDLPTELPEGLEISTYCQRQDFRDVFLSKEGLRLNDLPDGSVIGTSSLRRKTQLQYYRPDLAFMDLRGNLETRWRKLQESSAMMGIVLAAAGVIRLGWEDRITEYLPENIVLPAVGQGVIAIEIASHRSDIKELLQPLNHAPTELAVRAERSFLRSLEGGCQVPIGALATVNNGTISLKGNITSLDSKVILETTEEGSDPEIVGEEAASKMKLLGAEELLADIRQQMNLERRV
ncbi:MAG: hydroxymethylbilane synthase [Gracilibacter sp. BRH_c7a]|nr:MAG: hydroxymethylbilane synthase [Gracilibacter sp. BRH_c7a]